MNYHYIPSFFVSIENKAKGIIYSIKEKILKEQNKSFPEIISEENGVSQDLEKASNDEAIKIDQFQNNFVVQNQIKPSINLSNQQQSSCQINQCIQEDISQQSKNSQVYNSKLGEKIQQENQQNIKFQSNQNLEGLLKYESDAFLKCTTPQLNNNQTHFVLNNLFASSSFQQSKYDKHAQDNKSYKRFLMRKSMNQINKKVALLQIKKKKLMADKTTRSLMNYRQTLITESIRQINKKVILDKNVRSFKYHQKILIRQSQKKINKKVNSQRIIIQNKLSGNTENFLQNYKKILLKKQITKINKQVRRRQSKQKKTVCYFANEINKQMSHNLQIQQFPQNMPLGSSEISESEHDDSTSQISEVGDNDDFCKIDFEQRKILFIGKAGVGKTRLFKQFNFQKDSQEDFIEGSLKVKQFEYTFVDTPTFELDASYDQRELTILQFQKYFLENQKSISSIAIVVNFERTDLMKRKISEVYKYVRNIFHEKILIVVTDWEKSESKSDRAHLLKNLEHFKSKIIFVRSDFDRNDLGKQFYKAVKNFPNRILNLQHSIFEMSDDLDEQNAELTFKLDQLLKYKPQITYEMQSQDSNLFGLKNLKELWKKLVDILKELINKNKQHK